MKHNETKKINNYILSDFLGQEEERRSFQNRTIEKLPAMAIFYSLRLVVAMSIHFIIKA